MGKLEFMVLLAVRDVSPDAYGLRVRDDVERKGLERSLGAIHSTLDRLEGKGLLASALGSPSPTRGGKRKRLYELTPQGGVALQTELAAHASLVFAELGVPAS